jgi:hypothetical protein
MSRTAWLFASSTEQFGPASSATSTTCFPFFAFVTSRRAMHPKRALSAENQLTLFSQVGPSIPAQIDFFAVLRQAGMQLSPGS